jgi:hypothetical protein
MGHPLYAYTPHSAERRQRMSVSHRKRLGIPYGHVQIYGEHVPEQFAEPLRYWATWIAWKFGREDAELFVRGQKRRDYPDLEQLEEAWRLKLGTSEVREMIRAVREAVTYGN